MEYIKAIDKLGRIALPISFRRKIMLSENDNVIISVEEDTIIIRGAQVKCKLCGKNQAQEENKKICESCIAEIKICEICLLQKKRASTEGKPLAFALFIMLF